MKKRLILLFFLALHTAAHAQRIRMTDTTNMWRAHCDGGGTDYYSVYYEYHFAGDSTFGGHTYKRLAGSTPVVQLYNPASGYPRAESYFLREDSLAGMAWARRSRDTAESIIYNAAWMVNDTLSSAFSTVATGKWYISGIDSTQMNGAWYKVFRVRNSRHNTGSRDFLDIIEGIGSTAGPGYVFTGVNSFLEYQVSLTCFYNRNSMPVPSPTPSNIQNFNNMSSCVLAVSGMAIEPPPALYPVPVTGESRIVLAHTMTEGKLMIYSSTGQLISGTDITNTASVALPAACSTTPGLYFYRLTDVKEGRSFTGTFVSQ